METRITRKLKELKAQIIGIFVAVIIVIASFVFLKASNLFYFILGVSFVIAGLPFFIKLILEGSRERELDAMFLEFARNLVESVRAGVPISKSIINVRKKNYGKLNPYIEKLANQISIGIPIKTALETFARDINSPTIARAVVIISESEKAGGKIDDILDAVAKSVAQVEKLKKEREAAMYTLTVQGYIIFMIFIVIMLVMQFKILPIATGLGDTGVSGEALPVGFMGVGSSVGCVKTTPEQLARPFLYLLILQGFFVGLVIGKISEGKVKAGLKHSFILIVIAILITTGAKAFLG
jgi:archaeal flagellar protein FlaJ